MIITSKYESTCAECRRQIIPGDRIEWKKGEKDVRHAACTEAGRELIAKVKESSASALPFDVKLPVPEGLEYLPYQKAGIAYCLAHSSGFLIADEMGLGKTVQAIGFVNAAPEVKSVLVVCPASLRINWEREFKKWGTRGMVVTQFPKIAPQEGGVTIINYDILGSETDCETCRAPESEIGEFEAQMAFHDWVTKQDDQEEVQWDDQPAFMQNQFRRGIKKPKLTLEAAAKVAYQKRDPEGAELCKWEELPEESKGHWQTYLTDRLPKAAEGTPKHKKGHVWDGRDYQPCTVCAGAGRILELNPKIPAGTSWDLCVLDEAQYVKNPKAIRTKAMFALRKNIRALSALTGTPIENKLMELWPILQLVSPETWDPPGRVKRGKEYVMVDAGEGGGFWNYAKRYCNAHQEWVSKTKQVWIFDGESNVDELHEKLRTTCMVRRLKKDVLKDLPPKRRAIIVLPRNGAGDEVEKEVTMLSEVLHADTYEEALKAMQSPKVGFTDYSSLRHELAVKKIDYVADHVIRALESNPGKILVFAHHHDVIDELNTRFAAYGCVTLDGRDEPGPDRQRAVDAFQNDPKIRVFIGGLKAAGVGLTLTAASHVVFAEQGLKPSEMSQAEDRVHRIGQRNSVFVEILVFDGSIDAHMARLIVEKQDLADMALDETTLTEDVSSRPVVNGGLTYAEARQKAYTDAGLSPEECDELLAKMKWLASRCDGAQQEDGHGFSKFDANIGHSLAQCRSFSPKQALAARKLAVKYRRQLERFS